MADKLQKIELIEYVNGKQQRSYGGYILPSVPGLAVGKSSKLRAGESQGWTIYHIASNSTIAWAGRTRAAAITLLEALGPLTDWTQDRLTLIQTPGLHQKIHDTRQDVMRRVRSDGTLKEAENYVNA